MTCTLCALGRVLGSRGWSRNGVVAALSGLPVSRQLTARLGTGRKSLCSTTHRSRSGVAASWEPAWGGSGAFAVPTIHWAEPEGPRMHVSTAVLCPASKLTPRMRLSKGSHGKSRLGTDPHACFTLQMLGWRPCRDHDESQSSPAP